LGPTADSGGGAGSGHILVGSDWLTAQNPTTGDRRLNEPEDWVRREIQIALDAGFTVIPVLVDNARPLTPTDLRTVPEIVRLAEKQSVLLRRRDWDADVAKLQSLLLSCGIAPFDGGGCPNSERRLTGEGSSPSLAIARLGPPIVLPHSRNRDRERQRIADCLRRGRPCALVAIGGSGKTAIAARVAGDRSAGDAHNVAWLGLLARPMPPCHKSGSRTRLEPACEPRQARNREARC
jgi:hypothetical protein